MFYEKLKINVNLDLLRQSVEQHVFTLGDPIFQGDEYGYNNFGGWSLLSRTGDWKDGWEIGLGQTGHPIEQIIFPDGKPNHRVFKFLNISSGFEHENPTQAYRGEIANVLNEIERQGFTPRRARVSLLRPGGMTIMHKDAPSNVYMARIHIPLWTNEKCIHHCDGYDLHMPADGSVYILWVNKNHQVTNASNENRYHIIMDAYDTKCVTKNFKYTEDITSLKNDAEDYRNILDSITLSDNEIQFYESIRRQFLK
jgi:hypothetical protein